MFATSATKISIGIISEVMTAASPDTVLKAEPTLRVGLQFLFIR